MEEDIWDWLPVTLVWVVVADVSGFGVPPAPEALPDEEVSIGIPVIDTLSIERADPDFLVVSPPSADSLSVAPLVL